MSEQIKNELNSIPDSDSDGLKFDELLKKYKNNSDYWSNWRDKNDFFTTTEINNLWDAYNLEKDKIKDKTFQAFEWFQNEILDFYLKEWTIIDTWNDVNMINAILSLNNHAPVYVPINTWEKFQLKKWDDWKYYVEKYLYDTSRETLYKEISSDLINLSNKKTTYYNKNDVKSLLWKYKDTDLIEYINNKNWSGAQEVTFLKNTFWINSGDNLWELIVAEIKKDNLWLEQVDTKLSNPTQVDSWAREWVGYFIKNLTNFFNLFTSGSNWKYEFQADKWVTYDELNSMMNEFISKNSSLKIPNNSNKLSFSTTWELTREQAFSMIVQKFVPENQIKINETSEEKKNDFADYNSSMWYKKYIDTARRLGLTSWIGWNNFGPNGVMKKEQLLTVLHRFIVWNDIVSSWIIPSNDTQKNNETVSDLAKYVNLNSSNITEGYYSNRFTTTVKSENLLTTSDSRIKSLWIIAPEKDNVYLKDSSWNIIRTDLKDWKYSYDLLNSWKYQLVVKCRLTNSSWQPYDFEKTYDFKNLDNTPDNFNFDTKYNVTPGTNWHISNEVSITWIVDNTNVSISWWEYEIYRNWSWISAYNAWYKVNNWEKIRIKWDAPTNYNSTKTISLTVWTLTKTFDIKTYSSGNDYNPNDNFNFDSKTVQAWTWDYIKSEYVYINGISNWTPIYINNWYAEVYRNWDWKRLDSWDYINNEEKLRLVWKAPNSYWDTKNVELTVGNLTKKFRIYAYDTNDHTPDNDFNFDIKTVIPGSGEIESNQVRINWITNNTPVYVDWWYIRVYRDWNWRILNSWDKIDNWETIKLTWIAPNNYNNSKNIILRIWDLGKIFTINTNEINGSNFDLTNYFEDTVYQDKNKDWIKEYVTTIKNWSITFKNFSNIEYIEINWKIYENKNKQSIYSQPIDINNYWLQNSFYIKTRDWNRINLPVWFQ